MQYIFRKKLCKSYFYVALGSLKDLKIGIEKLCTVNKALRSSKGEKVSLFFYLLFVIQFLVRKQN